MKRLRSVSSLDGERTPARAPGPVSNPSSIRIRQTPGLFHPPMRWPIESARRPATSEAMTHGCSSTQASERPRPPSARFGHTRPQGKGPGRTPRAAGRMGVLSFWGWRSTGTPRAAAATLTGGAASALSAPAGVCPAGRQRRPPLPMSKHASSRGTANLGSSHEDSARKRHDGLTPWTELLQVAPKRGILSVASRFLSKMSFQGVQRNLRLRRGRAQPRDWRWPGQASALPPLTQAHRLHGLLKSVRRISAARPSFSSRDAWWGSGHSRARSCSGS